MLSACAGEGTVSEPAPSRKENGTLALVNIMIIYDNYPYDDRLKTAWGFSCLVELPQKTILFDTGGDGSTLLYNMKHLQIDPKKVDIIVLSHGHGDHVGGLSGFLEENSDVTVYLPSSFPPSFIDGVESFGAKVEEVDEARQLFPGVYTTGELDGGIKEQSLIITTDKGLVIVTGCSHPGIVNIVQKAKEVVPDSKIYLVMGGWHLGWASSAEIESIIGSFRQMGVEKAAPCHCSGDTTRQLFKEHYGEDYIESGVGKRIPIPYDE